jgi:hypothetical protein
LTTLSLNLSLAPLNTEKLRSFWVDLPKPGSQTEVYADTVSGPPAKTVRWLPLDIVGWAVGRTSAAVAIEVVHEDMVVHRADLNVHRPDIAAKFLEAPRTENSGFHTSVSVPKTALDLELRVRVVLGDETRVLLGVLHIWYRSMRSDSKPQLQPLMLTTLGRSGSTWVIRLLGQHSQIVAYRPFQYEPRVGSYWMQILKTLSEPANYLAPVTGLDWLSFDEVGNNLWQTSSEPSLKVPKLMDSQIQQWLNQEGIEALVGFCQGRIDAFYRQVAMVQGETEPVYFAEKYVTDCIIPVLTGEIYPRAREVILVRDLRDVITSILAYNAKRGYSAFGREHLDSDEDYIYRMRPSALHLLESWKPRSDRAYLLRYEDLISHPAEALGALLKYLELDAAPSTVEGMFQRASEKVPGQEQHRTSPDAEKSIGRWRRDLNPSLQALCQETFGDVLEEFGYEQ